MAERDTLVTDLQQAKAEVARLTARVAELEDEVARLKQPDPLETYINQSLAERRRILDKLREMLAADFPDPDLKITLSEESDALRFQGDGLFRSGSDVVRPDRIKFVQGVATRLEQILPCYTLGIASSKGSECQGNLALVEAVQIEGHTDSDGGDMQNLGLSAKRAVSTFDVMTQHEPSLARHLNIRRQPVLSVAAYGKMRPVASNDTAQGKSSNRRIDLRIIMYVPSHSEEIEKVRNALTTGLPVESR